MRWLVPVPLFFLALGLVGAQTGRKHIQQRFPPDENPQYFPVDLFSERPELSESMARWYASVLRDLKEPSLWMAVPKQDCAVYRLTVIPALEPSFVIRLFVAPDGSGALVTKWRVRSRNVSESNNPQHRSLAVSPEQVKKFLELLDEGDFWHISAEKPAQGHDGQEWLLEGKRNGEYHIVDRWNGVMEEGYYNACAYLYKLGASKQ
jgi:hypothetical protein